MTLLLLLATNATYGYSQIPNDFVFSAGWRVSNGVDQNIVQLGRVFSCGNRRCVRTETYEGRLNLPRGHLDGRHVMKRFSASKSCQDGPITSVGGVVLDHLNDVQELFNGVDEYILKVADYQYRWRKKGGVYSLVDIRDGSLFGPTQVVGFGLNSVRQPVSSTSAGLLEMIGKKYLGEIAHKDMSARTADEWVRKKSDLSISLFTRSPLRVNELVLMQAGRSSVSARAGRPIYVWHSIIFEANIDGNHEMFHEYGHDFNGNGCFDDLGHNKKLYPAFGATGMEGMVYVEYSPDVRDKIPMISVGYYSAEGVK